MSLSVTLSNLIKRQAMDKKVNFYRVHTPLFTVANLLFDTASNSLILQISIPVFYAVYFHNLKQLFYLNPLCSINCALSDYVFFQFTQFMESFINDSGNIRYVPSDA